MAEVGIYSDGVGSRGGYESPVSVEQLSTWTPDDVVAFLRDWGSNQGIESAFGLQNSLTAYAKENAPAALSVLTRAVDEGVDPSAIEGILEGVGEAVKAGIHLDWRQALSGVGKVMRHAKTLDVDWTESTRRWRRAAGRAMWFIEEGCRKDSIPSALTSEVWALLDTATTIPAIWQVGGPQKGSLQAVIMASLNDASGNVASAVRSVALWDYRCHTRGPDSSDEDTARARDAVQQSLLPILDRWLEDEGPNAAVPRAVMGNYLPQLHLLAPEWIEAHASDLFQGGLEDPVRRPTWTTYVSRAHLYDTVFCALRSWYARAAEEAAVWASATGDVKGTLGACASENSVPPDPQGLVGRTSVSYRIWYHARPKRGLNRSAAQAPRPHQEAGRPFGCRVPAGAGFSRGRGPASRNRVCEPLAHRLGSRVLGGLPRLDGRGAARA